MSNDKVQSRDEWKAKYSDLFDNPKGREIISNLAYDTFLVDNMYHENITSNDLFYREGKRSVLLYICNLAGIDLLELLKNSITLP